MRLTSHVLRLTSYVLSLSISSVHATDLQTKPPDEPKTYCHEPDAWAQWTRMVYKYPNDMTIQSLHTMWLGLCMKVDMGQISVDDAIILFERAREAAIRAKSATQQNKFTL